MYNKVLYEELLPEEFIGIINSCPVAYLPLGTLEWHGEHLPLGADGLQAKGFFIRLAKRVGGIVLPMLFLGPDSSENINGMEFYGMDIESFEHGYPQQLAGSSYWVEDEKFRSIIDSILSNLARAGFKIVVAHGHGPSTDMLISNSSYFEKKYGLKLMTLWDESVEKDYGIQTDHAAFNETSLMFALRPDLVHMEKIDGDTVPVGLMGKDPRGSASEKEGEEIIEINLSIMEKKLMELLLHISWDKKSICFNNVKNLIKVL